MISWDNFDYNQNVRHQTLRDSGSHFCATTGKACLGQYIPDGGLDRAQFHPKVKLQSPHIVLNDGNRENETMFQRQNHWIAEAIRYVHGTAIDAIFQKNNDSQHQYPEFPVIDRLPPQQTVHHDLGPILQNEGTVKGTYGVLHDIFKAQFKLNDQTHPFWTNKIQLIYGDQKTVSLIQTVQKERINSIQPYDRFAWLLAIPGLFHWRTNFIEMIYAVFSQTGGDTSIGTTLSHNMCFLNYKYGHNSPFHHKEEAALKAFDARVLAIFYTFLPEGVSPQSRSAVDKLIIQSGPKWFNKQVENIRQLIFNYNLLFPAPTESSDLFDHELAAHAKFIAHMEVYKTLKQAIRVADIGLMKQAFPRSSILFQGASKSKYASLSLYMTWLTSTAAADEPLQRAILANGLVNLRGSGNSWFEIDRLNEFLNLQMKTIMSARRTSTEDLQTLFERTAQTNNYSSELREIMESTFGRYINGRHQVKAADNDIYSLAWQLYTTNSTRHKKTGRDHPFKPLDLNNKGALGLQKQISQFNDLIVYRKWPVRLHDQEGDGVDEEAEEAARDSNDDSLYVPATELDDVLAYNDRYDPVDAYVLPMDQDVIMGGI